MAVVAIPPAHQPFEFNPRSADAFRQSPCPLGVRVLTCHQCLEFSPVRGQRGTEYGRAAAGRLVRPRVGRWGSCGVNVGDDDGCEDYGSGERKNGNRHPIPL